MSRAKLYNAAEKYKKASKASRDARHALDTLINEWRDGGATSTEILDVIGELEIPGYKSSVDLTMAGRRARGEKLRW